MDALLDEVTASGGWNPYSTWESWDRVTLYVRLATLLPSNGRTSRRVLAVLAVSNRMFRIRLMSVIPVGHEYGIQLFRFEISRCTVFLFARSVLTAAQALQIQIWPIDRLVFYARNPRKHDAAVDRMWNIQDR